MIYFEYEVTAFNEAISHIATLRFLYQGHQIAYLLVKDGENLVIKPANNNKLFFNPDYFVPFLVELAINQGMPSVLSSLFGLKMFIENACKDEALRLCAGLTQLYLVIARSMDDGKKQKIWSKR